MIGTTYKGYQFALVPKIQDFYRDSGKLPEVTGLKMIISGLRGVFKVPQGKISLYVAEGARVYKINISDPKSPKNLIFATLYYIPEEKQIDLYDNMVSSDIPMIQWKNKRIVTKNYSMMADLAGYGRLFQSIIVSS